MTTLILSSVGSSVGGVLGPLGSMAGSYLGSSVGSYFDRKIFGLNKTQRISGYRLDDLSIQTSTYGKTIPIIYGSMRVSGNIIWSMPIKEIVTTEMINQSYGKGFSRPKSTVENTQYNYYINVAIGICEGVIDDIARIWADNKLLDKKNLNFRLYRGTEEQMPDSLIQSIEGIDKTPAYRGLAYIVIENFQINDYGNRVPNFTFEVQRNLIDEDSVESKISGVNIIPGSGEFVYDTVVQYKSNTAQFGKFTLIDQNKKRINNNTESSDSDAIVALNQMQKILPNLKYTSVVVGWFANSTDLQNCQIYPGVESHDYVTSPDEWKVKGVKRLQARVVTKDESGNPIYGGTISDSSLIRYLQKLKSSGYKVILYPMLFLDLSDKPWRGRITGKAEDVEKFFGNEESISTSNTFSYFEFILHYADLTKNYIDGMIIGSEFKGITSIFELDDSQNKIYPGVDKFVELAASVRTIFNKGSQKNKKIITYAADWSEYHSINGEYNLDKLWASENIDVIGIDAYFPLTDIKSYSYTPKLNEIIDGWTSGEGYDYFYENGNRNKKIYYASPAFAWKNIQYWWESEHINSTNKIKSQWIPKMKKIWFTEYGFPSIHGASNMPNIFYNPESSEGGLPVNSNGGINFDLQRVAIEATVRKWEDSKMVENMLLWCYDARPYPQFPQERSVWSDGNLWIYGHWINGKLGRCLLSKIICDLFLKLKKNFNFEFSYPNTDDIFQSVDGFIINNNLTIIDVFKILQQCYFFDVKENEYQITFMPRGQSETVTVPYKHIILNKNQTQISISKTDSLSIPTSVNLNFISQIDDYEVRNVSVTRDNFSLETLISMKVQNNHNLGIDVPISMNPDYASCVAQTILYSSHYQTEQCDFSIPIWYSYLEPGDVIKIEAQPNLYKTIRILNIVHSTYIKIQGIIDDQTLYYFRQGDSLLISKSQQSQVQSEKISKTIYAYGVIPPLNNEENGSIIFACSGSESYWKGASISQTNSFGKLEPVINIVQKGNFGTLINDETSTLSVENHHILDTKNTLYIFMTNGELESIEDSDFYGSTNTALLGNEIIQFQNAELVGNNIYKLTTLRRGLFGTEYFIDQHKNQENFILLDNKVGKIPLSEDDAGNIKQFKIISFGDSIENYTEQTIDCSIFLYLYNYTICNFRISISDTIIHSPIFGIDEKAKKVSFFWNKRTRTKGEWMNFRDIIDYEKDEIYEIIIRSDYMIVGTEVVKNKMEGEWITTLKEIFIAIYKKSSIFGKTYGVEYKIDVNNERILGFRLLK